MATKTEQLRERIRLIEVYHASDNPLKRANEILQACKEVGLKFVDTLVATTSKDGILPDTYSQIEEIEKGNGNKD